MSVNKISNNENKSFPGTIEKQYIQLPLQKSKPRKLHHLVEEFSCSIFTGIMKVSIIQPFDFIRFRIQSSRDTNFNFIKFMKKFINREGLGVFLKGVNVTTFSVFTSSIIQFTLYQQFFHFLSNFLLKKKKYNNFIEGEVDIFRIIDENPKCDVYCQIKKLSFTCGLAGMFSGIGLALLLTPVDNVRIKLQATQNIQNAENKTYRYTSSFELIKDVYKRNGIKGLYIALPISLVRESIASLIYFGSFEYMKNHEKVKYNRKRIKIFNSFLYGAFAGGVNWLITLPIDIIKTKMISDTIIPGKQQFKNYRDCARSIYQQSGFRGFYKGFSVVFTRALVVNGVVLTSFDLCRSKFIK
jgi:solute carrier family 25 (mitochondrial carnitine/acylcarnitine transporter), member 20/29